MSFAQIDLICLSHLRWSFVLQRPQHLMTRFAGSRRVFFLEEPVWQDGEAQLKSTVCQHSGVYVVTPKLPHGLNPVQVAATQRQLLADLLREQNLETYMAWYYTPMAMEFTSMLDPVLTVYDCMDELTAFAGAPAAMKANEAALFQQADLVFTGGASLFASKRNQHRAVYQFPSSVDVVHFRKALAMEGEPADQACIPEPRLGYAGVIDERMDLALLAAVAQARPAWQFVLLGPVVKIDPACLPKLPNIHLLGLKHYADLPEYLAGWEIGMLPFALNEATQYISPTKTPEYLAAGLRVISTPIRDVVSPYGELGLVSVAKDAKEFIAAAESILEQPGTAEFSARVSDFLAQSSWDQTGSEMEQLMEDRYAAKYAQANGTASGIAASLGNEPHSESYSAPRSASREAR